MKEQLYKTTVSVLEAIEAETKKGFSIDAKTIDTLTKCLEILNRISMFNDIDLSGIEPDFNSAIEAELKIDTANAERLAAVSGHMFEEGQI